MSKKEPIRILQVVNIMDRAGLETMIMNYYRNIDRDKIQFDFLTHRPENGAYDDEIKKLGGKIYHAPRLYPKNFLKYFKFMKRFFYEHKEYKIVHSHIDTMSFFPLCAAKKAGVPIRISHSHSSKLDKDFKFIIKYIARLLLPKQANYYYACGDKAGCFLYGKNRKFSVVKNAIDISKFKYDIAKRRKIRSKLGIENQFVVGHVGRYIYIKNQSFIIDIFNELLKVKPNSLLMLVGSGNDYQMLKDKVNNLGLNEKVLFLIDRSDVDLLYQAMDVFVMPSLFEGLPVVGVEAQTAGLPCLFSNKISSEVLISKNSKFLDINDNISKWVNEINNIDVNSRNENISEIINAGFDIKKEVKKLEDCYLEYNRYF